MNAAAFGWMLVAIVGELIGTTSLKMSQGGKRPLWYLLVAVGYAIAFILFSRALKVIPLGISYALWAGLGIVGSAIIGGTLFGERLSWTSIAGIAVILVGIAIVNAGMPGGAPPG